MGKKNKQPHGRVVNRIAAVASALGCIGILAMRKNALHNINDQIQASSIIGTDRELQADRGWAPIHVYIGDPSFLEPKNAGYKHYAQSGQDQLVLDLLENKRKGYFIDLAANDPIELSNTAWLEEKNDWNGLCIEPNPAYWYRLAHRKCQVVGSLVGKNMKQQVEVKFDSGVKGGIVNEKFDNKGDEEGRTEKRYTATVLSIFEKFNVPSMIDYLNLDVEGAEYWVMKGFPFDDYLFKIMTVERPQPQLQKLLKNNGYVFIRVLTSYGETLWVHESMMKRKATKEIADLKHACWNYETKKSCDVEYWNKLLEQERRTREENKKKRLRAKRGAAQS